MKPVAPDPDVLMTPVCLHFTFFRQQRNFHGINLNALHSPAVEEFFKQPIVVCAANLFTQTLYQTA